MRHRLLIAAASVLALFSCVLSSEGQSVKVTLTQVGNPNNSGDPAVNNDSTSGYGAVSYTYNIGADDVTVSQYVAFLNAVASTDQYGLYNPALASDGNIAGITRFGSAGSYTYAVSGTSGGNDPITYVSWLDAARFCNWLQNGQPTTGVEDGTTTEEGVYTLDGDMDVSGSTGLETKNPNATWWVPSENEWYKAAFYDSTINSGTGGYWTYATRGNATPGNVVGSGTNEANFLSLSGSYCVTQSGSYSATQNYLTPVGAFTDSASHYGTFDQNGDVYEWNDAIISGTNRGRRGGDWNEGPAVIASMHRDSEPPNSETDLVGFRVARSASIPIISSTLSATGTNGFPFNYKIATTGSAATSFEATGLPPGLTVSSSNGLISGTLTTDGTFASTIGAINSSGTDIETLTITVVTEPIPAIISSVNVTGTQGFDFNYQIQASNNPTSFDATGLPTGLAVSTSNGLISGTATVDGTYAVGLSASNLGGTGTTTLSLVVIPEPIPVISSGSTAAGQVQQPFDYQIQADNFPLSFGSTTLPQGLALDPSTGEISGTPTTSGSFSATISAINLGGTGTATLAFFIAPRITSSLTASGSNGAAFNYQIAAITSATSYNALGLPPGLSINPATGIISGTLAAGGIFPVTIDAISAGGTGYAVMTITVTTNAGALAGTYDGLGAAGGTNDALFTITVTNKGAFTASLTTATGKQSLKGAFDQYGLFSGANGPLSMNLSTDAVTPGVSGVVGETIVGVTTAYNVQAGLQGVFKSNPTGEAGTYTAVIPAVSGTDPTIPHAPGYGTMTVNSKGAVSITGKLGDGTTFSARAQLHADGKTWTLFSPLYKGKAPGTIAGAMTFELLTNSDCDGVVDWIKPAQVKPGLYPGGFALGVNLLAAGYGAPPLLTGTGSTTLDGGGLGAPIVDDLSVSSRSKVTVTGTNGGVAVSLSPAKGTFSGSFRYPGTNKKTSFSGAIYQKPVSAGFGLFLGPAQSGSVEIDQ